ncbi:MAG: M81 family metallopeptidase [Acidobacteria bacterium]|nr:M81 family metallopeptidase [Acidobacteriota bacterium]
MRILINECKQEISSFNPVPSTYHDFLVHHGTDVISYHRPVRSEPGGAIQVFEERGGIELIGGFSAKGITSAGTLSREGFRRIADEFLAPVRAHHASVNALYFALHGALASEDIEDCEGYLLEETRKIVGPAMPIAVSLDLHGILTDKILEHSTVLTVFHTNPHVDFYQTGQRAALLLLRYLDGATKPVHVRVPIPALVRGSNCITSAGLIKGPLDRAIAFENGEGLSGGIFIGNPFTDVVDLCSNVFLTADRSAAQAQALAVDIANQFWPMRREIQQPLLSLAETTRLAMNANGRIVLVDAADATSSGASGDSNAILRAFVEAGSTRTLLTPVVDKPAVDAAFRAGIGAEIDITVGGTLDPRRFTPLPLHAKVRVLSDGEMRSESHGEAWYGGPTAVLQSGPFTVVVTSRPVSLYDRSLFLSVGQDPATFDMTVVKSPLCQPRFFNDGAEMVLNIDAPGATSANVKGLGHIVARRPLYPLDDNFDYTPTAKVFRANA